MINYISSLLVILFAISAQAQHLYTAPVGKGQKVATVSEYEIVYNPNGKEVGKNLKNEYAFDKKGKTLSQKAPLIKDNAPCNYTITNTYSKSGLILKKTINNCGKEEVTTYTYNKHKRLVEERNNESIYRYQYDKAGNIIALKVFDGNNKYIYKDSVTYNAKKHQVLHVTLTTDTLAIDYYYYFKYTLFDSLETRYDLSRLRKPPYTVDTLAVTRNTYDAQQRMLTHSYIGSNRQYSYEYKYAADGSYTKTGLDFGRTTTYLYNAKGVLTEQTNGFNYVTKYIYNDDGLLIRVDTYDKQNRISHSEVYEYTYW